MNDASIAEGRLVSRVLRFLMRTQVFKSPEVCRVYIGSFNAGHPINMEKNPAGKALFEAEQDDLLKVLKLRLHPVSASRT